MWKRKQQTGIELSYQQKIHISSSNGWHIAEVILDTILLTLLLYGCLGGLFSTCEMVTVSPVTIGRLFFIGLFTMIAFDKKVRSKKVMAIYFGIAVFILYIKWRSIADGMVCFAQNFTEHMNYYFGSRFQIEVGLDDLERNIALTVLLVFTGWLILLCYCIFGKMYKRTSIALFLAIVIFSLPFVVGLIPELKYLLAFLMGFLPLAIKIKWKDSMLGIQVKLVSYVAIGILTIFCAFLLPRDVYQENLESIRAIKKDIQDIRHSNVFETVSYSFSDTMLFQGGGIFDSVGGLSDGVLGSKGKITYDKKTDFVYKEYCWYGLEDVADYDIYLRSYVGTDYTNKSWHSLSTEAQQKYEALCNEWDYSFEQIFVDLYGIKLVNSDMILADSKEIFRWFEIVKRDVGRKHMLLPYGNYNQVFEQDGLLYTKQSYLKKEYTEQFLHAIQQYTAQNSLIDLIYEIQFVNEEEYRDNIDLDLYYIEYLLEQKEKYQKVFEKEKVYRDFVYETYTKVPEDIAPRFQEEIKSIKAMNSEDAYIFYNPESDISVSDALRVFQIAGNCKKLIDDKAYYSLEPGVTPEGKDFIDYFLYENKKGYCSYFATAAVIYLRLCGIPTRYVEGYKFASDLLWEESKKDEREEFISYEIEVTDENAHAWVEVYINGLGWIPYDVTPGLGSRNYDQKSNDTEHNVTSSVASATPTVTPSTTPSPQVSNDTQLKNRTDKGTEVSESVKNKGSGLLIEIKVMIAVMIFLCAMVISILLRKKFIERKHKKLERIQFQNKRVKFYYNQVNKMVRCKCLLQKEQEISSDLNRVQEAFPDITIEELEQFIQIVEKATFGSGQVSDYECMKIKMLYMKVRETLYRNSGFIKKIYYKVWKVY